MLRETMLTMLLGSFVIVQSAVSLGTKTTGAWATFHCPGIQTYARVFASILWPLWSSVTSWVLLFQIQPLISLEWPYEVLMHCSILGEDRTSVTTLKANEAEQLFEDRRVRELCAGAPRKVGVLGITLVWLGLESSDMKLWAKRAWRPSLTWKLSLCALKQPCLCSGTRRLRLGQLCKAPSKVLASCRENCWHRGQSSSWRKGSHSHVWPPWMTLQWCASFQGRGAETIEVHLSELHSNINRPGAPMLQSDQLSVESHISSMRMALTECIPSMCS